MNTNYNEWFLNKIQDWYIKKYNSSVYYDFNINDFVFMEKRQFAYTTNK